MLPQNMQIPSTKTVISAAASAAATAVLLRSLAKDYLPHELRHYLYSTLKGFLSTFSSQLTVVIDEFNGFSKNTLFQAAETYLGTIITPSTHRFRAILPEKASKISLLMERNSEIIDNFNNIPIRWRLNAKKISPKYVHHPGDPYYNPAPISDIRYFELSFHKKHKHEILTNYVRHILERFKALREEKKTLKLHTLKYNRMRSSRKNPWLAVNLDHPANFETLAMDLDVKERVKEDLERFVKRREYYRRVGKAWKRGYLLFGPPGTGKSSLIAAMANFLNFDIYDLELTDLRDNAELRRLLISTANRSILVVEDIDCSIEFHNRLRKVRAANSNPFAPQQNQPEITLSGFLNFIDGLWSSCGDERIIIFTTNHKDKLDSALLRPGRMDVHIHMSYCTPYGFRVLASNYLDIEQHLLFADIEYLIANTKVTPAEVGEQLLKHDGCENALGGLIEFLEEKYEENQKAEAKNAEEVKLEEASIENGEVDKKGKGIVSEEGSGVSQVIQEIATMA